MNNYSEVCGTASDTSRYEDVTKSKPASLVEAGLEGCYAPTRGTVWCWIVVYFTPEGTPLAYQLSPIIPLMADICNIFASIYLHNVVKLTMFRSIRDTAELYLCATGISLLANMFAEAVDLTTALVT